jgi:transcription antitermination factor NusA-like protein
LNTNIANILYKYINKPITVKGDDIMVRVDESDNYKKASVSITYSKEHVAIGHTGINIRAGESAPLFAYSTELNETDTKSFIDDVCKTFYIMVEDMFIATTKVIV